MKVEVFFPLIENISVFDWIQNIVAEVGDLRSTIAKSQHSALFAPIYVEAVFQKGHLETPKGHMEIK